MKFLRKEVKNGKTIIVTEESYFIFWKKERKFVLVTTEHTTLWLELPNFTVLTSMFLDLQLCTWNSIEDNK